MGIFKEHLAIMKGDSCLDIDLLSDGRVVYQKLSKSDLPDGGING